MGDTTVPIFLLRRCPIHKKRTWHLTAGKKDDARLCVECLAALIPDPPVAVSTIKRKGAQ